MRLSINQNRLSGPYGGGNKFVNNLERYLVAQGHRVHRRLLPELDAILIVSAKADRTTTAYDYEEIKRYRKAFPKTGVILRVNSCDEQRGADLGINRAFLEAAGIADRVVFVSEFMRNHYLERGLDSGLPTSVILTGAQEEIFHPKGRAPWRPGQKVRIVTHHWSANYLKGFDIYERLDRLLDEPSNRKRLSFTFLGNVNPAALFRNTEVLPPQGGREVARALKEHHLYVTGARFEPGGNHYIEAMCCGLPVLYLQSGSAPEYCSPFGLGFNLNNFEAKLMEMLDYLAQHREAVLSCDYSAERMCAEYTRMIEKTVREKAGSGIQPAGAGARLAYRFTNAARPIRVLARRARNRLIEAR